MEYGFAHEGKGYTPSGHTLPVAEVEDNNKLVEAAEIEWLKGHPDKVFLYYKRHTENEPDDMLHTWLGTFVGEVLSMGPERKFPCFGPFPSVRQAVTARIYGVLYHGWYYTSSGDYCRLKKAKRQ